ncbi:MAG TPA: MFS transporter [Candidatus Dormibacteraeota bacterium]
MLAGIAASISSSFSMLLPVVPVLVERQGPHGAAGAATASLFFGAVLGELVSPWLMTRWSSTRLLIGGQLLYAVPSLIYVIPAVTTLPMLVAAGLRGLGFGVSIVVSVVLVAELSQPHRRGTAIGYFGLAISLPGVVLPSLGVSLVEAGRTDLAATIALLSGLVGARLALLVPVSAAAGIPGAGNLIDAARRPAVLALFVGFVVVSCSFGGIVTYAPVALPAAGVGSAAVFLFIAGACRAASRWLAGVLGDRRPAQLVLIGGIALTLLGLVALAAPGGPIVVVVAAMAYGTGYGAVQTAVYLVMVERGGAGWGPISALWNSAIDLGASLGGVLLGVLAALYGYATAIWVLPAVVLISVPLFLLPVRQPLTALPLTQEGAAPPPATP